MVLKVLVACEYSGTVRDQFSALGHEAWSCDFEPAETEGNHFQCDVTSILDQGWDLMIAHPPCERLCVSGARWKYEKVGWAEEQKKGLALVRSLLEAPITHIALENPIGIISSEIREPDQIIQPWQFGHGEIKSTCLWLKNLPLLRPTDVVSGREPRVHKCPPGKDRKKLRAWKYNGIAKAMAIQWSSFIQSQREKGIFKYPYQQRLPL